MSKPRVWTEVQMAADALARLSVPTELVQGGDRQKLAGAQAVIIGGSRVDDEFLDAAGPSLKVVVRFGIGYDSVDVKTATERGIMVVNLPDGPTEGTAEHAVGLMLAVAKCITFSDRRLHADGVWANAKARGVELRGKTLGVIGFGRIGRRVAEICARGLKMNVLFHTPDAGVVVPAANITRVDTLDELLRASDVVSLHARLDARSRHMIGEAQLRLMKPGAILINTARGEVVDEAALVAALLDKRLGGAGLDVFEAEPSPPDNPLFHLDNVVATPHVASSTAEGSDRMSNTAVDEILLVLGGKRPVSLVNEAVWPGRVQALASA